MPCNGKWEWDLLDCLSMEDNLDSSDLCRPPFSLPRLNLFPTGGFRKTATRFLTVCYINSMNKINRSIRMQLGLNPARSVERWAWRGRLNNLFLLLFETGCNKVNYSMGRTSFSRTRISPTNIPLAGNLKRFPLPQTWPVGFETKASPELHLRAKEKKCKT